jgi:hypothetical protein
MCEIIKRLADPVFSKNYLRSLGSTETFGMGGREALLVQSGEGETPCTRGMCSSF